jgi:hypothetical protein
MTIPATPQPPYPTFTETVLNQPANYGVNRPGFRGG